MSTPRHPSPRSTRVLVGAALAAAALALGACAPAGGGGDPTPTAVTIPDTPVGAQTQWVIDEINAGEASSAGEVEARFDETALAELSADDLLAVFGELRALGPWTATSYEGDDAQAVAGISAGTTALDMSVAVSAAGRMTGLFFAEPAPERTPAADLDDLRTQVEDAGSVSLTVAELGADAPALEIGPGGAHPIGSVFKLWVLLAVVDAVEAGALTWEDTVTIDAEVRSLPSGELQNLPDGTEVSVREAAEKMIAISDNTATDALMRAVGTDAVTAALAETDYSRLATDAPFPTTRALFWLGWGDEALAERWSAASGPVERAAVLDDLPAGVPPVTAVDPTQAAWTGGADWFATHADVIAVHAALQDRAATDAGAPLRGILSTNPGIEFASEWDVAAYKGGSSVGVLAGSWVLESPGRPATVVVVTAASEDPGDLPALPTVFGFAQDAAALLGDGATG
ncbi:Cpe/LpqF family protein [Microbacterium chocolatum]|uniref:serine hydrolase n=1 Tax=Microbacterium aurantiacum TaxID=162393 RepID=UPI00338EFD74